MSDKITTDNDDLLVVLQSIPENTLSKTVLVPLFKALKSQKVEFHGGVYEQGKDIIVSSVDATGDMQLTAVQVKKIDAKAAASSKESFSEIVTQLQQALETPIPQSNGSSILPIQVVFITPYPIDVRALQSRFEGFKSLSSRAKIIDGVSLAQKIKEHIPQIAAQLIGEPSTFTTFSGHLTGRSNFLSAISQESNAKSPSFFIDIDLAIGRLSSLLFAINSKPRTTAREVPCEPSDWDDFKGAYESYKELTNCSLCDGSLELIEDKYKESASRRSAELNDFRELETQKISTTERRDKLIGELQNIQRNLPDIEKAALQRAVDWEELREKVEIRIAKLTHATGTESAASKLKTLMARAARITSVIAVYKSEPRFEISTLVSSVENELKGGARKWDANNIGKNVKDLLDVVHFNRRGSCSELLTELGSAMGEIRKISRQISDSRNAEPNYMIPLIDGNSIAHRLETVVSNLERDKNDAEQSQDPGKFRQFLEQCSLTFRHTDCILRSSIIRRVLGLEFTQFSIKEGLRLSTPSTVLFDSGVNLLVLGEAGAGKTTCLENYARRQLPVGSKKIVFFSVGRLVSDWISRRGSAQGDLYQIIYESISTTNPHIQLPDVRREFSSGVVLLLDGFDEGVSRAPWIYSAIVAAADHNPSSHFILSSRQYGDYVKHIPFLPVTICEMSSQQKKRFIRRWFRSDRNKREKVMQHLRNNRPLREALTNPLGMSVLCFLAEQEVALPKTKLKLYKQRFRLLMGAFDISKGIPNRISTSLDDLQKACRKLAFGFHSSGITQGSTAQIRQFLLDGEVGESSPFNIDRIIIDLHENCGILKVMNEAGELGFGHLSNQEYFAAEEIASDRTVPIESLLEDDWWRGALGFFAKTDVGFKWLKSVGLKTLSRKGRLSVIRMIGEYDGRHKLDLLHRMKGDLAKGNFNEGELSDLLKPDVSGPLYFTEDDIRFLRR